MLTPTTETFSRLRLWQLISPTLPIGAYAYSQAQEYAVTVGWIEDAGSACEWISGQLQYVLPQLDVPILARLYHARQQADDNAIEYWNCFLQASRGSAELLAEDRHLGSALARLLPTLGISVDNMPTNPGFITLFSQAAVHWSWSLEVTAQAFLWMWCENQVSAAIKLIPLGQSAGQRLLLQLAEQIPAAAEYGLQVSDADIGATAPGLGIASALHETQYSRLFRS